MRTWTNDPTSIDVRLMGDREREAIAEANAWVARKRRALRARRSILRRLKLWGRR
jgi:hypothetical protein